MKDSRNWVQHCLDICSCVSLALAGLLVLQPALIAAADKALYAAKSLGRNRLVMSGQVVAWPNAESA